MTNPTSISWFLGSVSVDSWYPFSLSFSLPRSRKRMEPSSAEQRHFHNCHLRKSSKEQNGVPNKACKRNLG